MDLKNVGRPSRGDRRWALTRFEAKQLDAFDTWIVAKIDASFLGPEAIRRLLNLGLKTYQK